jgi:hypothetical protein
MRVRHLKIFSFNLLKYFYIIAFRKCLLHNFNPFYIILYFDTTGGFSQCNENVFLSIYLLDNQFFDL